MINVSLFLCFFVFFSSVRLLASSGGDFSVTTPFDRDLPGLEKLVTGVKSKAVSLYTKTHNKTTSDLVRSSTALVEERVRGISAFEREKTGGSGIYSSTITDFEGGSGACGKRRHIGLSIDGGGIRGLIPALLLQRIEEESEKKIYELIDSIAGTSVGGILALGLVTPRIETGIPCSAAELAEIFADRGMEVFPSSPLAGVTKLFFPGYSSSGIESVLNRYFDETQTLRDTLKPVLVTSTKLDGGHFIFNTRKANDQRHNFFLRNVARATSAAPTYFPAATIRNVHGSSEYSLMDGGLWCNNPARLLYDDLVIQPEVVSGNLSIISIGTGDSPSMMMKTDGGLVHSVPVIDAMMTAPSSYTDEYLSGMLGKYFHRIHPSIGIRGELDDTRVEYLDYLRACTEGEYSRIEDLARYLLLNSELDR